MPYSTPELRRVGRRVSYNKRKAKILKKEKEYRDRDPAIYSANRRQWRYGLNAEAFRQWIERQNGLCAMCDKPLKLGTKAVHVDHCHDSQRIRGILCAKCNLGLGRFGDALEGVLIAVAYLDRSDPEPTWLPTWAMPICSI